MKKTILKYSSLLAFISSPFINSQTYAAECASGTVDPLGCEVTVRGSTYVMTGNIVGGQGISFDGYYNEPLLLNNTTTLTGNITASEYSTRAIIFLRGLYTDNNNITINGDILGTAQYGHGIELSFQANNNTINLNGNLSTNGSDADGILATSDANDSTINVVGNISTQGDRSPGINF